ncbi:8-amino-7-oxononanoate synthase [Galdieria sulphuraria]|uniref:8-amino-7-oxononanoate synthase n=1 Tax=Galdieria sulphuraria TaxID=130081 RepID=M2Y8Z2_GALSU|nr:8-amino-7-oxononanoate synthase [Galdieria sulphuraria]EME32548.1 8-amino-7-oxononanoate synthase [Galdieria sulphuraria]GJD12967.1 8-amino-7-oxononanoate synthase [Galdieria sulphuraria]|eukprot:XP_005709068.1 8-amino-7-oxononanoate synthase [Galdieria sulphuraria]
MLNVHVDYSLHSERVQYIYQRFHNLLTSRARRGLLRSLSVPSANQIDFSSNDYLCLSRSELFMESIKRESAKDSLQRVGSTGSRLLSGNSQYAEDLERLIADFHCAESALLFNSGFTCNLSIMGYIAQEEDLILVDQFAHSSIHEGCKISRSKVRVFPHNDIDALRNLLKDKSNIELLHGSIFIVVESIYSMDGDFAPVEELLEICLEFGTHLIVDEAHSAGVYGKRGEGIVQMKGLHQHPCLFMRVVTFGKAFGCHGAAALCRSIVREYLINYARPLIYSTSLSYHGLCCIRAAYSLMNTPQLLERRQKLFGVIDYFRSTTYPLLGNRLLDRPESPIQAILVPGNKNCIYVANLLRRQNISIYPIRSPTVPKGAERIRITLHSDNTCEDIDLLVRLLESSMSNFYKARY